MNWLILYVDRALNIASPVILIAQNQVRFLSELRNCIRNWWKLWIFLTLGSNRSSNTPLKHFSSFTTGLHFCYLKVRHFFRYWISLWLGLCLNRPSDVVWICVLCLPRCSLGRLLKFYLYLTVINRSFLLNFDWFLNQGDGCCWFMMLMGCGTFWLMWCLLSALVVGFWLTDLLLLLFLLLVSLQLFILLPRQFFCLFLCEFHPHWTFLLKILLVTMLNQSLVQIHFFFILRRVDHIVTSQIILLILLSFLFVLFHQFFPLFTLQNVPLSCHKSSLVVFNRHVVKFCLFGDVNVHDFECVLNQGFLYFEIQWSVCCKTGRMIDF